MQHAPLRNYVPSPLAFLFLSFSSCVMTTSKSPPSSCLSPPPPRPPLSPPPFPPRRWSPPAPACWGRTPSRRPRSSSGWGAAVPRRRSGRLRGGARRRRKRIVRGERGAGSLRRRRKSLSWMLSFRAHTGCENDGAISVHACGYGMILDEVDVNGAGDTISDGNFDAKTRVWIIGGLVPQ